MNSPSFKGYRIILEIESSSAFSDYTGIITKTLIFTLAPELQLVRRVKGIVSPLAISPPFHVENEYSLGEPTYPVVEADENGNPRVNPVDLNGEYVFHLGGDPGIVDHIVKKLASMKDRLAVKVRDTIVYYRITGIHDITMEAIEKGQTLSPGSKVTVHLKSPAQIFNVFTPSKILKFSPSAIEILMVPYALTIGQPTINDHLVYTSFPILGSLIETWYSLRTLRPIRIPFKNKPQMLLSGRVTYLIDPRSKRILNTIREIITNTEILGVGRSRQNGFGTTVISA